MTRKWILLITYTALMILLVLNFGPVWSGLRQFGSFFKPLIIGIAIAFVLNRPCMFIDRHIGRVFTENRPGINRGLAVVITYLLFFLLLSTLTMFVIPQIIESIQLFIHNVSGYLANSQEWINRVTGIFRLQDFDLSSVTSQAFESIKKVGQNVSGLFSQIVGITAGVIGFIANLFIALIFSIYLLADKENILTNCKRVCKSYLPSRAYTSLVYVYHVSTDVFNKFVYGQLTDAFILGVLCFIGMLILGFDYPLMISTLIGVTALVPMIGAYIGGSIAFLVLAIISPSQALWFVVFLIALQQFEGNIIYPRVVGGSLGLPGIWVLLATIVGGGLAGPLGILLGVPIATILYTLLKNHITERENLEQEGG